MGDDDEFAQYVEARWRMLVHAAMMLGCSLSEAEDITQSTLLKAYTSWSRVVAAGHRDAYVSRMLLNTLRASRRRHWWRERPTEVLPDVPTADETARVDGSDAVARALGGLSRQHREVVVLRYYVHLDEAEMAQTLGVPRGTVKSRLSRALHALAADAGLVDLRNGRTS